MNAHRTLLLAAFALAAGLAQGQEFRGFIGPQWDISQSNPGTYQWRLDYQQGLGEHWYLETGWVNDGHIPGHLRDGYTLQFGIRTRVFSPRWSLGIATGVTRFYDTIQDTSNAQGFADIQGFLWLTSGELSYYAGRWIISLQANVEVAPPKSYNGFSALIGVGYQLQAPDSAGPRDLPAHQAAFTTHNEISIFAGQTVPNGGKSDPKGIGGLIEYRHGIARYLDLTFSYINQGDNAILSRVGLATQIWPTRAFGNAVLGVGIGAYFAVDQDDTSSNEWIAGMVSPTFSYRFGEHWLGRFLWNRTVTGNNTNTDFFSLGVGYRW